MKPEPKKEMASVADFAEIGVRAELIPILQKLGFDSIEKIKSASPNKLFNDVCGTRKKMKLKEVKNPTLEEVEGWLKD
jgi:lysyl-tRNA synthetase class 2